MDQLGQRLKQLSGELKSYFETRLDLFVINVGEQITAWVGASVQKIVGYVFLGVGLFFGLISAAIYIGDLLDEPALGYLIVGTPIVLIGIVLVAMKPGAFARNIQQQIMKDILKSIDSHSDEHKAMLKPGKEKEKTHE